MINLIIEDEQFMLQQSPFNVYYHSQHMSGGLLALVGLEYGGNKINDINISLSNKQFDMFY